MSLLPKPYPDEAIGSVIARGVWHTGLPIKRLLSSIYGTTRSCNSFLMGTRFAEFTKATGLDAEELLLSHTVFPYATAFMPNSVKAELKAKALSPKLEDECLSSLTKNVSHGVPFRRLCPRCVQEELATYGETYWHRQHMLPGALVCTVHNETLAVTSLPLRGRTQTRDTSLPHLVRKERIHVDLTPANLMRVAEISCRALNTDTTSDGLLDHYRGRALELGYAISSGQVASKAFSSQLQNFFGVGFLGDSGCAMAGMPWPSLMLRPGTKIPFATPKHVLMQAFLDLDSGVSITVDFGYTKPGKKTTDFKRLDTTLSLRLKAITNQAKVDNRRMTVKELLTEAGSWNAFKHHRDKLPLTKEMVLQFRESEQSERQVGGRAYWRKRLPGRYSQK